jgi:hypothetical protein
MPTMAVSPAETSDAQSYQTTLGYISMARQMNPARQDVFMPDLPGRPVAGAR